MHNWRLLLLAFIAVLQPIASFTERNLVDGRQQCCDREPHSLFRDTRLPLDETQKTSEERRLNERDDIHVVRRFESKPNTILIRSRGRADNREKHVDARLPRVDYRIARTTYSRRDSRQLERDNLDRTVVRERVVENSLSRRNDFESTLRSSRHNGIAHREETRYRTARLTSPRTQIDSHNFRPTTLTRQVREEIQRAREEADLKILQNRNNRKVANDKMTINILSSVINTRVDSNRQKRSLERHSREDANEFRAIVSANDQISHSRLLKQDRVFHIAGENRRIDNRERTHSTRHSSEKVFVPQTHFQRSNDRSTPLNARNARLDITARRDSRNDDRNLQKNTRVQSRETDEIQSAVFRENRREVNNLVVTRPAARNGDYARENRDISIEIRGMDSRKIRKERARSELSRRETEYERRESGTARRDKRDVRDTRSEDRNRQSHSRINVRRQSVDMRRVGSEAVRRDTFDREVTRRDRRINERRQSVDMLRVGSHAVRIDTVDGEVTRRNRRMNERRQSVDMIRVGSEAVRRDTVDREVTRRDTRVNAGRISEIHTSDERRNSAEKRDITRNISKRDLTRWDTRSEDRMDSETRRVMIRRDSRKEDKSFQMRAVEERRVLVERRGARFETNTRADGNRGLTRRDTRDEARNSALHTRQRSRSADMRQTEPVPARRVVNRYSTRRHARNDDKNRQMIVREDRRESVDLRRVRSEQSMRGESGNRDQTRRERTSDQLRTNDAWRQTYDMRREKIGEDRRETTQGNTDRRSRSLDRLNFREVRLSESIEIPVENRARLRVMIDDDSRGAVEARFHNSELTRNQDSINDSQNKNDSDEQKTGNWQMLFYTLQGIYICGVIVQMLKGSGSEKLKTKNQFWWTPASQRFLKVD